VIVTGGAGYIGSHACKALAQAGYVPVTVDDLRAGHRWAVRWGPLETVDVTDGPALDVVFQRYAPTAVLHFAAHIEVGESNRAPLKYYRNNVGGLISVVDAMARHGVERIVFSSTAAVYGEPERVPIGEDAPLRPGNPYGATKLACERLLADVAATGALRYTALRYFNAAGADPDGAIGEAHDPETHLVPNAVRAVRDPDYTLDLKGGDFPTPDGSAIRDYVHVSDLARAHVMALDHLRDGGPSCSLNVGTGRGASVQEVIDACARVLGQTPKYKLAARRPGDPAQLIAEAARIRETLGWRPTASDLETIIATAAAWHDRMATTPA